MSEPQIDWKHRALAAEQALREQTERVDALKREADILRGGEGIYVRWNQATQEWIDTDGDVWDMVSVFGGTMDIREND